jgi:hypothetical protein
MPLLWTATRSFAVVQNWDAIKRPFNTKERYTKAKNLAANVIPHTFNRRHRYHLLLFLHPLQLLSPPPVPLTKFRHLGWHM